MGVGLPNGVLGGVLGQKTVGSPPGVGSPNGVLGRLVSCWVSCWVGGKQPPPPPSPLSLPPSFFPSPPLPPPPLFRARGGRFAAEKNFWGVGWADLPLGHQNGVLGGVLGQETAGSPPGVGSGNGRVAPGSWTWPSSKAVGSENGRVAPGCWVTQHPVGCLYAPDRPPSTSHGFLGFLHGPGGLPRALSRSYPGRRGRWRARWPPSAAPATVRPQTELPLPVPEGPRSLLVGRRGSRRLTRHRGDWGPRSHFGPGRRVGRASEVRSLYYSVHRKTHMGSATTRWGSAGDGEVGNISFRVRRGRLPSLGPIGGVWGGRRRGRVATARSEGVRRALGWAAR